MFTTGLESDPKAKIMDVVGYLGQCKHMDVRGNWEPGRRFIL